MSSNSNLSINSLASTHHGSPTTTAIGEDAAFTTQLLMEFNNCQARHISILSTNSSIQYVPHSPTPSVQEVASPPPLQVHIAPNGIGHYPPISPGTAETILHMEDSSDLHDTMHAVTYSLISTVRQHTAAGDQKLTRARHCINQLTRAVHNHEAKIHHLRDRMGNVDM